jgi:uncharacterized iron-regulated membrane protein
LKHTIARRWHRVFGLLMLLPLTGWALTGAVFFLKPGYAAAYQQLAVRTYELKGGQAIAPEPAWLEVRLLRTILGTHLLVRKTAGWSQLDPDTLAPRAEPTEEQIRELISDAISVEKSRYGEVVTANRDGEVITSTGVRISLDWQRLSLSQRGPDTNRIDFLYRIHYLQWTGFAVIDRVLGGAGIVLVLALAWFGARLLLVRQRA